MSTTTAHMRPANRPRENNNPRLRLRLEFTDSVAESVCIAGTFNDWRPEVTPMIRMGGGRWAKEICLPPGNYEYCLVVDGKWIPDPRAAGYAPNPFGGMNSVLQAVPPDSATALSPRTSPSHNRSSA